MPLRSLEALTEGLFDYAGLFPPAALPFAEMLREGAGHTVSLNRPDMICHDLVVTVDRLNELSTQHLLEAGFKRNQHLKICLVGVAANDGAKQANHLLSFNRESRLDTVAHEVTTLEMHSALGDDITETAGHLMPGRFVLAGQDIQVYWEPKLTDAEWSERLDDVFAVIDGCNQEVELPIVGLKIRCDGEHAVSPETLARIIPEVNARTLPFKATQGLHAPLADDDHPLGFLSLAVAFRMADKGLAGDDLLACLTETDPSAFDFASGLRWREHHLDAPSLGHALRLKFQIGSCSIREPDEALAALWPVS